MKKILIVEDDPIVGRIYRAGLEREGFEVHVAADGQQGLNLICELCPDAVLLDLMLPKMNGLDILKKVRSLPEFNHVRFYVLTNAYIASMISEATAAGATAVFNKSNATPKQIADVLLASAPVAVAPQA